MQKHPSLPLRVGIGVDAGEARPFEGGYRGRALNLAARSKDQARAGPVLATEAPIHLAGQVDGLVYVEKGLVHPKGFALPVRVIQVAAEGRQPQDVEEPDHPEVRTFLMADMRSYTVFAREQSDWAMARFETWYGQMVDERVRAHGGRVLDLQGDAAFAVFTLPREAIEAAVEVQEEFHRAVVVERQLALRLGIGVETGEAIPMRGKYTGLVIYEVARLCRLAGPGDVLIGQTLSHLVRKAEGLVFVTREQPHTDERSDPVRIIQVMRENAMPLNDPRP